MGISYGLRYVPGTEKRNSWTLLPCCQKGAPVNLRHVRDDEERALAQLLKLQKLEKIFDIPAEFPISAVWRDLDKWSSC